jgi:predicted enzyme related to lactoylglutathione lyase
VKAKATKSKATKSKPTKSRPTKSKPTKAKATRSKPTKAKATRSKPTKAKATRSKPTRSKATKAKPTKSRSTRSTDGFFVRHDLMSTDRGRSKAFYGELFDWQLEDVKVGGFELTRIWCGGRVLGAIMPFDPAAGYPSHWVPYVAVSDVDATCREVGRLGGTVCMGAMEIPIGRFAMCEFPRGALFSPFTAKTPAPLPEAPPAGGTFCWDELMTPDPAAARAFYTRLFGWQSKEMQMPGGSYVVCEQGGRQVCGLMATPPGAPEKPAWLAYVAVEDVDASAARAESLGAQVVAPPSDIPGIGRFAVLLDPTGATIALFRG